MSDVRTKHGMGLPSAEAHQALLNIHGENSIPYTVDGLGSALAKEFIAPFYLYQFNMYIVQYWPQTHTQGTPPAPCTFPRCTADSVHRVWRRRFWFSYWVSMCGQTTVVVVSGLINRRIIHQHQAKIAALADYRTSCDVRRAGEWRTVSSQSLVAGDLVRVCGGDWKLPADLLLLSGAVIVNESGVCKENTRTNTARPIYISPDYAHRPAASLSLSTAGLTGESMPVRKFSAANADASQVYSPQKHKRHTLYAGTTVLQASHT